jgi:mono/diheme cytochrome c family protein
MVQKIAVSLLLTVITSYAEQTPNAQETVKAEISFPRIYDLTRPGMRDFRIPKTGCFNCHPEDGKAVAGNYPQLAGSEWVNGDEKRLIKIILCGLKGPISVSTIEFPNPPDMPSFGKYGANWDDQKIADVLTFIRNSWSNEGTYITKEMVAEVRKEVGDHKEFYAPELTKHRKQPTFK